MVRRLGGLAMLLLLFAQPEPIVVSAVAVTSATALAGCGSGSCVACCTCHIVCDNTGDSAKLGLLAENGHCLDCQADCVQYLLDLPPRESCTMKANGITGTECEEKTK
jgi:hypothetical protein